MALKVIYVEDDAADLRSMEEAVELWNGKPAGERLELVTVEHPALLSTKLDWNPDIVVADIMFPKPGGELKDMLAEILQQVGHWSAARGLDVPIPVIAYTDKGAEVIDAWIASGMDLYDIWDKNYAKAGYVAWRLGRLAQDLARDRPYTRATKVVMALEKGASFHELVVEMAKRYSQGLSERDQIKKAGVQVTGIGQALGVASKVSKMWDVVEEWEPLSRAVSQNARGHARHVLNVFWLGYSLIHNEALRDTFSRLWDDMITERGGMRDLRKRLDPLEAFSRCWFYAGLFHDVAGVVEKHDDVIKRVERLRGLVSRRPVVSGDERLDDAELVRRAEPVLGLLPDPLARQVRSEFKKSVEDDRPDHGVVAAIHLIEEIDSGDEGALAREAARAVALHNLFPKVCEKEGMTWELEPVAALLAVCDQLQAWDRERFDEAVADLGRIERAELVDLVVREEDGRLVIRMEIDYVIPRYLGRSPDLRQLVADQLGRTLALWPDRALRTIRGDWPFRLEVVCSLGGIALTGVDMSFG